MNVYLLDQNFNKIQWSICLKARMPSFAQPQLNILSGGLIECLDEPWHVGMSTAERLSTTLLPIPERVIQIDNRGTAKICS